MSGYASKSDQKITFFLVAAVIVATIVFVIFWFMPRNDIVYIEHGIHTISARVAGDDASRAVGLGGVTNLGPNEGLLMVYESPDNYPIWMKGMEIPIDVLWLNQDGEVIHIEKNMKPESYPTSYSSKKPALYVLELKAGAVNRFNIKIGSRLNIPEAI